MTNLEEAIRERAYHLWTADGQPEGKADVYWLNAQREILTTSLEGPGGSTAADSASLAARPAKKAKVARSTKGKVRAA
jgi:Protein of unknown function (DUF2934)